MRHTPFIYGAGPSSFDGFHDAIWTRKAGWGTYEGGTWGGAPFDAHDGPRGTMAQAAGTAGVAGTQGVHNGHHHGGPVGEGTATHSIGRRPVPPSKYGEHDVV